MAACSALRFPGCDFTPECCFVGNTTVETVLLQDAQLDFGHVQPTPVLWWVMQLQFPGNLPRLGRFERFIQRRQLMRIEIVQHDPNPRGFGVACVHQPLYFMGEVDFRPLLRHMCMPPAGLRFYEEKEVAYDSALWSFLRTMQDRRPQGMPPQMDEDGLVALSGSTCGQLMAHS